MSFKDHKDHKDHYRYFAKSLRTARKEAGLTQKVLAKRLGRPQSFVAKYEGCERRLDPVEYLYIAQAIGADWKQLLQLTDKIILQK